MRRNEDFLDSWLEYSSVWDSPERFRLWSGISAISACLQRRVYTFVRGQKLYPNTYILLVGAPGSGKGNAMKFLASWLKDMPPEKFRMAPDGLTKRAFYQTLESAGTIPQGLESEQHALTAFIEELGVFIHAGDYDFIYTLCHIYDCPSRFHYKTQTAGENFFVNASFTLLSACTPKALRDLFTEAVMELGISARTVLVYAETEGEVDIFGKPNTHDKLEKDLKYDLNRIRDSINGEYQFDEPAASFLVSWSKQGFSPVPSDPRFEHYNARRFVQYIKLCMILAASQRDETVILLSDCERAKEILLEVESVMPEAIKTVGANPILAQQQGAITYVEQIWQKFKRATEESELYRMLGREINPQQMTYLLNYIAAAKWIDVHGRAPNRFFYPRGKAPKIVGKEKN